MSKTDFVLDTVSTVSIYDGVRGKEAEELINDAFNEIRRYEKLFSAEIPDSDVSRINSSKGAETKVSPETAELIETALKYCELTEGVFDITIRPVSKLWDFRSGKGTPPDKKAIEEAIKHVDYKNIVLNKTDQTVILTDPQAEIDLGGIAKGYIADRIKAYLKEKGVTSGIINLGGNVVLIGSRPDGAPFSVGIEKPFKEGEIADSITESDVSIVTSGDYERYFYYEDKLYHHILDTRTGYPADSDMDSVTVVSAYSVDGDALSTACFCLGRDKATELIKKTGGDITISFH